MQKVKDVLYITVTSIILFLSHSSFLYTYVNLGHIQIKHILACVAFFFFFFSRLFHWNWPNPIYAS